MKTFIEWLLDYKSRKPLGTPISDLRDDTKRAIAMGDCKTKGTYKSLLNAMAVSGACSQAYDAAESANRMYGAYLRAQMKDNQ
jgi:coenzyme F420-reducing hydrogenase gamma subunit